MQFVESLNCSHNFLFLHELFSLSHSHKFLKEFIEFSQTVDDNWEHSVADEQFPEDHLHPNKLDLQSDSIVNPSQDLISSDFVLHLPFFESHTHLSFKELVDFSQVVEDNSSHSIAEEHFPEIHWHPNKLDIQSNLIENPSQDLISTDFVLHLPLFESHTHLSFKELVDFSHVIEDNSSHLIAEEHFDEDHWHPNRLALQSDSKENPSQDLISTVFVLHLLLS